MGGVGTMYPEDAFQHQVMEEEFDLQLHLLQEETPDPTLFPEVEDKMAELPHLKDGTVEDKTKKEIEMKNEIFFMDQLMEEGVLESLAFCGLIGLAAFAPQLIGG